MITLNLGLWIAVVFTAAASCTLVLCRPLRGNARAGLVPVGVGALLLTTLFVADARTLFGAAPVTFYLAQAVLPAAALLIGGYLAARWYTWRSGDQPAGIGTGIGVGLAALAVALGACVLCSTPAANAAIAGGIVASVAGGFFLARTGAPRVGGLALALVLLWSAAFLVYLAVFPGQIAVATEQPEDGAPSELATRLIIAAMLVAAFVLGFLNKRRG